MDFTVQWKLTLPEGASADTKNITIDDSIFEVESINQDGQILTVVLKPKTNFTNLQQLADAVHTHKDSLDVTFASIQLGQKKDTAARNYTFVGTPSISLNADVFNGDQVNVVQYNWNPTQKADAADPENGSTISYTYKTPTRTVLLGDLRIGEDTEHEAITEIDPQDTHAIYGDLNVEPIQHAVESLNTSHGGSVGNPVDDVALENVDSSFTAELSFPDQMRLASNLESSISLEGANGVFEIKNVEKLADRNAITVSIALKDARNYDNFADLYKQVMSVAPKLTVKVDGVEVDAGSVSKGDLLHMEGTLEGTFYAKATRNSKTEEYAYQWVAIQDPLGTDANQDSSDTQTIGLTLKVKQATPEKIEQEFTLNGDLLLDDNTEHEAVAKMETDKDYTVTGRLQVTPIKDRLEALNTMYGGEPGKPVEDITLKDTTCIFNATIIYPETVILPGNLKASTTLTGADSLFQIEKITKDEAMHTVTVTMSLKESYNDFTKLYNDVKAIEDTLDLNIADVQVARDKVSNGDRIHFVGEVNGSFHGIATKNETTKEFSFGFTAVQDPQGRDFTQGQEDTATIALTAEVAGIPEKIEQEFTLNGDLLLDDNTEHEAVAKMETDKDYTVTGRLQVTPIKDRLEALNTMYGGEPGKPVEDITLKDTTCIFNATITYPETVILPGNLKASTTLTGADSLFQIEKITKDEAMHTVTVTMSLKESYNDFTKLYNDVKAIEDTLDLNIADVQVARDKVSNGDRIHFVGEVNGSFHGIATKNKTTKEFSFGFTAVQDPQGRDFTQSQEDTAMIALTAEVAGIPEKIEQEFTLNGDLLLDDNTEHEAVAKMETDKDYTVTGRLQVTPIKDRLEALNTMYGGEPGKPVEDITLKDTTCIFNATITYPETVILPGNLKASTTLTGADSLFQIEKITKDEAMHTVTVTMSLKESYNGFTKLYNDVKAIEDTLDLNIAGVQVARDKVSNGDRIHFVGEVNGSFHGIATKNKTTKEFSFGFTAVQDPEGRDFTQSQEDTATIALTAEVEEKETPTNPDEPEPHNEEPEKPDVNKPSKDGTKSTNKPSSNTKSTNTGLQIFTASWVVLNVAALTAIINLKRRQKRNHTK